MVTDKIIKKGLPDETSVKAGYKQTEIGVIPKDWDVKEMEDFTISVASGKSNTTNELGDYPIYGSTGIIGYKKQADYAGDKVLIARVGANAGTVNEVSGKYCVSDNTLMVTYQSGIDINFSYYQLINFKLNKLIFGSGQPLVTGSQIKKIAFALPKNKSEQTVIATVLSDTDALIEQLEKLIAKKKAIKQGAMQQLLAPKEHWEEKTIFQIADNKKELFDDGDWIETEHITNKGIRLIQTGNIGIGTFVEKENRKYIFKESFLKLSCKELRVGDLLICRLAEPAGRACVLPFIGEEKVITSVDVTIFRPREEIVHRVFLSNIFSTSVWFKAISEMCGGTTHKRISRSALGRIKIFLPPIEEQIAIATILSDMDAEIENLEQKRGKYTMLKQSMMQQLLTGRIRINANN